MTSRHQSQKRVNTKAQKKKKKNQREQEIYQLDFATNKFLTNFEPNYN